MESKFISFLVIISSILLISCETKVYQISSIEQAVTLGTELEPLPYADRIGCYNWEHYVPYPENMVWFEKETIRLNFHVMYDSLEQHMMPWDGMKGWIWLLLENVHERLDKNPKMRLPVGNDTPNLNPMLRYKKVVSPETGDDDGIYKHVDQELYFYLNKGKDRNNYNRDVIKKYAINDDTILNVFLMPTHPDSVKSPTYKNVDAGIALGTSIKMGGFEEPDPKFWEYSNMFNHEVGHVFGLLHAWTKNDGCDDTPPNPNCFQETGVPPCEGPISNNLMDYNNNQMALTPCQIGKMHSIIHNVDSDKRQLIIPRWCDYQSDHPIIIETDTHWTGNKDLNRDIIIKNGATLQLTCRISMAAGSKIIVEEGSKIYLDNVKLHNDCGDLWNGIIVKSRDTQQSIVLRGKNVIEDIVETKT